ncbi:hypothetical protein KGQ20_08660 [Catenulispora sp. NF23]|uniref:Uncharacterized protein n=1 Tax=Catenulispora pinistramenti TaxID=2705254 RepID=A0ABS5KNB9_9ACTN|nr:hypothetical protein [Catenulispora pinistramenti]MBS2532843.1 hypothetical protein [Catenulispora pinistramenti]MBS2547520.1 hypothetical protein [Catenulispora pinistramenti]
MTAWIRVFPGSALPGRLTAEDVEYLDGALRNAYGVFPHDPATGLDLARTMAASVLNRRGLDAATLLRPFHASPNSDAGEIRQTLDALAVAIDRIAVDGG